VFLEASSRKVAAVLRCVQAASPRFPISVAHARAEEYAAQHPGLASVVVARAVAELAVLAEYAAPLLTEGGHFVAMKGELSESERSAGERAARIAGLERVSERHYELPAGGEKRAVVVFARIGAPEVDLPRRPGRASKRPLGT
jgi:16S rRNA (guanine527-N7)-methyltransferase